MASNHLKEYLIKSDTPLVHGGTNKNNNDKLLILKSHFALL